MNGFISVAGKGGERKAAELIALKTQFSSSDLATRKGEKRGGREEERETYCAGKQWSLVSRIIVAPQVTHTDL